MALLAKDSYLNIVKIFDLKLKHYDFQCLSGFDKSLMVTQGMDLPHTKTFLNHKRFMHYLEIVIALYSPEV